MTTNQTIDGVPGLRALLERIVSHCKFWHDHPYLEAIQGIDKELRAMLDAPAEPFSHDGWSIDHSAGRPILMHNNCSVIEAEQAYGTLELIKSAAQHQGEPVHECQKCNGRGTIPTRHAGEGETEYRARCKLYAEQPAPVAVVLPVDPERERLMEIVQQYPNIDPLEYDAAVRTLRK